MYSPPDAFQLSPDDGVYKVENQHVLAFVVESVEVESVEVESVEVESVEIESVEVESVEVESVEVESDLKSLGKHISIKWIVRHIMASL